MMASSRAEKCTMSWQTAPARRHNNRWAKCTAEGTRRLDDRRNLPMNAFVKFNKGIFRSPIGVRAWLLFLVAANMVAPLFFITRIEPQLTLAAFVGSFMLMVVITASTGFTRLLGLGHLLWAPLLIFLWTRLDENSSGSVYGIWLRILIGLNALSLLIDGIDVVRYLRGDRAEVVKFVIPVLLTTFLLSGCGRDADVVHTMRTRPVTVLELEERDFARELHLTGSVTLYREERVGSEVDGRILSVLDLGMEVDGPAFDEEGAEIRPGDLIAELDDTRYQLRVNTLQARLASSVKELEAARQDTKAADAELTISKQSLGRQERALETKAVSRQAVDEARSRRDSMAARKAQSQAVTDATSAKVDGLEQELQMALEDLKDCRLLAPFSGRITEIHVSQGAVVDSGTPVVSLSLMDPIQVQVAVSADHARRIRTGDRALLFPKDPLDPDKPATLNAIVYENSAVADPLTRTFRLDLMVRNERRLIHQMAPETKGLPVVVEYLPVARRYLGEEGPLFVRTTCVYRENGKTYVLRLPGVSFREDAQRSAVGRHVPEKVEVALGDDYFTVIKWNFRSLTETADLREGDFLIVDPKKEHLNGVAIGRHQWLLRPGDLVPVRFVHLSTPMGLYVPVDAVTMIDGRHVVFGVRDGKAQAMPVTVHEAFREFRRIEGNDVRPGISVIVGGVHYVSEGQPVSIVSRERFPE